MKRRRPALALLSLLALGSGGAVCIDPPGATGDAGSTSNFDAGPAPDGGDEGIIVATCSEPAAGGACTAPHCTALRTDMGRWHGEIVTDNADCSVDEDCIVFDRSLSCTDGREDVECGVAIAGEHLGSYQAALEDVCQEYCKSCYEDCDGFNHRCPDAFAYCSAGKCASWLRESDALCPDDPDICGTVRNPLCPTLNPTVGAACSLDEEEDCSYCQGAAGSGLSVYDMRCVDGRWRIGGMWVCDNLVE